MAFEDIIEAWKSYGLFEFYLPFVLMFVIFYGLLSKSKIFGESKEKKVNTINVVVSFIAAMFVMVSPVGVSLTVFFGTFFTQTMVILTLLLSFMLILYMIMPATGLQGALDNPGKYAKYLIPIAALVVLFVFIAAGGPKIFGIDIDKINLGGGGSGGSGGIFPSLTSQDTVTIVLILVFAGVIWWLSRGDEDGKEKEDDSAAPENYEWKLVPKKKK
jgi:hypothetical protein